jgi:hypothetical protein
MNTLLNRRNAVLAIGCFVGLLSFKDPCHTLRFNVDMGNASRGAMMHPYDVTELRVKFSVEKKHAAKGDTTHALTHDRKYRVLLP